MAIANGTCVSFCNQPKAQFGYLMRVTPVCRCLHPFCGWRHLAATSRESKAHFGLPWVRPWDNRGKFTRMERGLNACQTHRSMYPSIFNCFPVIQPVSSNVRHFSTFLPSVGTPWDNRGKSYMDGKRIQCWSNASQHIPIYLQPFTSYSKILVGNCNFFLYPLHLTPLLGCSHWNSGKKFGPQKTRIMGYQAVKVKVKPDTWYSAT